MAKRISPADSRDDWICLESVIPAWGGLRVQVLPITAELLRVLKPSGTFVLNIKEKTTGGERSTYVLESILSLRKSVWLWTDYGEQRIVLRIGLQETVKSAD